MANPCFHCVAQRPSFLLPPVSSRFRVLKENRTSWSLSRSSHRIEFDSWRQKICCFRNDESSSGTPRRESTQDNLFEERVEPELDQSRAIKKDFISVCREAVDIVFQVPGRPWTVPWTAETILQPNLTCSRSDVCLKKRKPIRKISPHSG